MSILENLTNKKMDDYIENFDSDSDLVGGHIGYKFHQINTSDSGSDTSHHKNLQDGGVGYTFTNERIGGLQAVKATEDPVCEQNTTKKVGWIYIYK